jgi:hypothetical protein
VTEGVDSDWVKQERDHEYRMAKLTEDKNYHRRQQITDRVMYSAWAVGVILVVGILAALVFFWQQDAGNRGQKAEMACLNSGGTWTGLNGGTDICIERAGPR